MKQTKTLAQVANDIENGNNLHEYYNNDGATIKTGSFESFGDFLSYFDMHYRPMLERIENGEDISENDRHLLNFLASDLLAAFKTEYSDESEEDDTEALTAEELRRMEREAVTEFVRRYVGDIIADISYYSQEREPRREFKRKLSRIAYGVRPIHWYCGINRIPAGHVLTEWLTDLYKRLADGTHERTELYNRYARLVARHEFDTHYKNFAKSLYAADCEGTDKLQKKQAVIDGVRCLCDKMEEYVTRQDDPDYKGWEPQMVIRYESTTGDEDNYWNLFVYCEGPNDRDDDDYLSLRTSWQHVWTDEDGKDATDDYGSEEHETRAALLRYLFYDDAQEFDETDETVSWERITDVWVD